MLYWWADRLTQFAELLLILYMAQSELNIDAVFLTTPHAFCCSYTVLTVSVKTG